MLEINALIETIKDLNERSQALRGYL